MSEETATYQVTKSTPNLNTLAGVVSDILENLTQNEEQRSPTP